MAYPTEQEREGAADSIQFITHRNKMRLQLAKRQIVSGEEKYNEKENKVQFHQISMEICTVMITD